jgi:hypothetical protein
VQLGDMALITGRHALDSWNPALACGASKSSIRSTFRTPATPLTWKPKIALPAHSSIHPYERLVDVSFWFIWVTTMHVIRKFVKRETACNRTLNSRRIPKCPLVILGNSHAKMPPKCGCGIVEFFWNLAQSPAPWPRSTGLPHPMCTQPHGPHGCPNRET